ncbi:MAG: hypothetical protein LWW74_06835 [Burkholderiales bacterium]|nr:hypothetical protein [Burkholderiales bacterium]
MNNEKQEALTVEEYQGFIDGLGYVVDTNHNQQLDWVVDMQVNHCDIDIDCTVSKRGVISMRNPVNGKSFFIDFDQLVTLAAVNGLFEGCFDEI